jgi:drug/metabolite transporter (DMT)-like permease
MYSGLILLVFIGFFVAWLWNRGRRKFGLPVNGKHWAAVIIVFVVLMVLAYGASRPH